MTHSTSSADSCFIGLSFPLQEFKCDVCSATFTTNGSLTRHSMIHKTVKAFQCPLCTEQFHTSIHCKRHMKTHSQTESNDEDGGDDFGSGGQYLFA
jgi:uncharacterized Zn-finger protein